MPAYLTIFIVLFCLQANSQTTRFFVSAHQDDWQLFMNPNVYESIKSALSFLSNPRTVKFIDLSDTKCKGKVMLGGYHGIALTKCFANEDPRSKEIAKYLEEIF